MIPDSHRTSFWNIFFESNYQTNDELRKKLKKEGVTGSISSMSREKLLEKYNEIKQIKPKPIIMHKSMKKPGKVNANEK